MELSEWEKNFTSGLSSYSPFSTWCRFIHTAEEWGCFILLFYLPIRWEKASEWGRMKNLQNYAKNVQLVKRNIILCVASFYIASFQIVGGVRLVRSFVRSLFCSFIEKIRWALFGTMKKWKRAKSDEHKKYILLKWWQKMLLDIWSKVMWMGDQESIDRILHFDVTLKIFI